jgi:hypothetical protein
MLTDAQKAQVRLMITRRPDPTYMAQLAASDTFALSELATFLPKAIAQATALQTNLTLNQTEIAATLVILQAS